MSTENQNQSTPPGDTSGRNEGLMSQTDSENTADFRGTLFASPGGVSSGTPNNEVVISAEKHTWHFITKLDPGSIEALRQNCLQAKSKGVKSKRNESIDALLHKNLERQLDSRGIENSAEWRGWDDTLFFANLQKTFGKNTGGKRLSPIEQIAQGLAKLEFNFDANSPASWGDLCVAIDKLLSEAGTDKTPLSATEHKGLVENLVENLKHSNPESKYARTVSIFREKLRIQLEEITTIDIFLKKLSKLCNRVATLEQEIIEYGLDRNSKDDAPSKPKSGGIRQSYKRQLDNSSDRPETKKQYSAYVHEGKPEDLCNGCGRYHDKATKEKPCPFKDHPDFNRSQKPFVQSTQGREWAAQAKPRTYLPGKFCLHPEANQAWMAKHSAQPNKKGEESEIFCSVCEDLNSYSHNISDPTVPVTLLTPSFFPQTARALIDTGALHANYISNQLAARLIEHGTAKLDDPTRICSALSGKCSSCLGRLILNVEFLNDITNLKEKIKIPFKIVDISYDVIIGRPSIMQFNLLHKLYKHLTITSTTSETTCDSAHTNATTVSTTTPVHSGPAVPDQTADPSTVSRIQQLAQLWQIDHMSKFIDQVEDSDGIPLIDDDDESPWQRAADQLPSESGIPEGLHGSPELKSKLTELCTEFSDIFSTELRPEPADIPAMEIKIDHDKWNQQKGTRLAARPQTTMKQEETARQIDTMKKFNVIQESDRATKWGQMLLVPKPNGKWRFVSDHDTMNQCSEAAGWPIPNIPVMLQRIGSKRARFYGIMDLTSGYHQAPLSYASQVLTAFITFMGVFEYLRVPMGIKGAAAYFQQVMATFVLVGLIHVICECYQDDILTYGETEEEFLQNLRKIFLQLRRCKLTVNPKKC